MARRIRGEGRQPDHRLDARIQLLRPGALPPEFRLYIYLTNLLGPLLRGVAVFIGFRFVKKDALSAAVAGVHQPVLLEDGLQLGQRLHRGLGAGVLVAIEGREDAERIKQWLLVHPFANPVELCVLSIVVPIRVADPYNIGGFETWSESLKTYAEDLVKTVGAELMGSRYSISTRVATGEVAATVAEQAKDTDLVVVASHGRKGLERFLLGSASHAIVHHVTCPILVVR